jgi:hypothetical protein
MSDGGLLGRLRAWLGSLFGGDGEAAADAPAGTCAVCGTTVEDPASGCPLCGSTDVEAGETGAGDGATDDGTAGPERRSMAGTADDAAAQLRDVRGGAPADGPSGEESSDDDEEGSADPAAGGRGGT